MEEETVKITQKQLLVILKTFKLSVEDGFAFNEANEVYGFSDQEIGEAYDIVEKYLDNDHIDSKLEVV